MICGALGIFLFEELGESQMGPRTQEGLFILVEHAKISRLGALRCLAFLQKLAGAKQSEGPHGIDGMAPMDLVEACNRERIRTRREPRGWFKMTSSLATSSPSIS